MSMLQCKGEADTLGDSQDTLQHWGDAHAQQFWAAQ